MNDNKDAFDLWREWAQKPRESMLMIDGNIRGKPATSVVGTNRTWPDVRLESVMRSKADVRRPLWVTGSRQKCPTGKSLLIFRNGVKPVLQKYFCFPLTQISSLIRVSGLDKRGVAQRHQRGAGCGGRGSAREERGLHAHGEVVGF